MRATSLALLPAFLFFAAAVPVVSRSDEASSTRAAAAAASAPVLLLPFRPIGQTDRYEWIGDAIDQSLRADLAQNGVQVASRPVEPVNLGEAAAVDAARRAGAAAVVFGSYQIVEDRVRISGRVIATTADGTQATLQTTGTVRELFDMEDELARQLNRSLPSAVAGYPPRDRDYPPPQRSYYPPYDDGSDVAGGGYGGYPESTLYAPYDYGDVYPMFYPTFPLLVTPGVFFGPFFSLDFFFFRHDRFFHDRFFHDRFFHDRFFHDRFFHDRFDRDRSLFRNDFREDRLERRFGFRNDRFEDRLESRFHREPFAFRDGVGARRSRSFDPRPPISRFAGRSGPPMMHARPPMGRPFSGGIGRSPMHGGGGMRGFGSGMHGGGAGRR